MILDSGIPSCLCFTCGKHSRSGSVMIWTTGFPSRFPARSPDISYLNNYPRFIIFMGCSRNHLISYNSPIQESDSVRVLHTSVHQLSDDKYHTLYVFIVPVKAARAGASLSRIAWQYRVSGIITCFTFNASVDKFSFRFFTFAPCVGEATQMCNCSRNKNPWPILHKHRH